MQGKVPVGVTSVAGYTVTLAAAVGAVLAFLKGDRSDQTLGVLASAGVAVLAFLSTQLGRYAQAHAAVKKAPPIQIPSVWTNPLVVDSPNAQEKTIAAQDTAGPGFFVPEIPPDFVDEPQDDGIDQVPEHERRDLHDGGRC